MSGKWNDAYNNLWKNTKLKMDVTLSKSQKRTREKVSQGFRRGQRCSDVTVACITTWEQSVLFFFFFKLQMCTGAPGLQLHATSHWRCSRTGGNGAGQSLLERRSGAEERRKMYVKIMCLQDALYKAIKLSASETSHGGRDRCLWHGRKKNPLLFHVCFIVSFGGEWFL